MTPEVRLFTAEGWTRARLPKLPGRRWHTLESVSYACSATDPTFLHSQTVRPGARGYFSEVEARPQSNSPMRRFTSSTNTGTTFW